MIPTRIPIGYLDAISGLIFIIGISLMNKNTDLGLVLIALAILKQFSGR